MHPRQIVRALARSGTGRNKTAVLDAAIEADPEIDVDGLLAVMDRSPVIGAVTIAKARAIAGIPEPDAEPEPDAPPQE